MKDGKGRKGETGRERRKENTRRARRKRIEYKKQARDFSRYFTEATTFIW